MRRPVRAPAGQQCDHLVEDIVADLAVSGLRIHVVRRNRFVEAVRFIAVVVRQLRAVASVQKKYAVARLRAFNQPMTKFLFDVGGCGLLVRQNFDCSRSKAVLRLKKRRRLRSVEHATGRFRHAAVAILFDAHYKRPILGFCKRDTHRHAEQRNGEQSERNGAVKVGHEEGAASYLKRKGSGRNRNRRHLS